MPVDIVLFSPERQALQQELIHHPKLIDRLQEHPAHEFEVRLAQIATYCGIIMDGAYLPADFDKLAAILVKRLMEKRTIILTSPPSQISLPQGKEV